MSEKNEGVSNTPRKSTIMNLVVIGLFAALCYIALAIFFFPVGPMFVHFGNLIVVLAALLFGGWQGGLAGSIGMGLFDLTMGQSDAFPKTFVLKFMIGLTVGLIFSYGKKKEKFPSTAIAVIATAILGIALSLVTYDLGKFGKLTTKVSMLFVALVILAALFIIFSVAGKRMNAVSSYALVAATAGMVVNLVGEAGYKFVYFLLSGSNANAALIAAVAAQASTLINAVIAVAGGVALYIPLSKALKRTELGKYF